MGWWLLRLTVEILTFLRLTVIFFPLRLTEMIKINFHCYKKFKINFHCGDTHLTFSDQSGIKKSSYYNNCNSFSVPGQNVYPS